LPEPLTSSPVHNLVINLPIDQHLHHNYTKPFKQTIQNHLNNQISQQQALNIYEFTEKNHTCTGNELANNAHFERHQKEQKDLIAQKRVDKMMIKERKMREKWFEYILAREQHMTRYQIQQIVSGDEAALRGIEYWRPFDSIDDMQEKYLKPMPEFESLFELDKGDNEVNWLGDCLQVMEFLITFESKLRDSLKSDEDEESSGCLIESFDNVLESVKAFRSGNSIKLKFMFICRAIQGVSKKQVTTLNIDKN